MQREMILLPYDPEWVKRFKNVKQELSVIFGNLAIDIQHFGSTAIVGMSAKSIIDVMVIVSNILKVDSLNLELVVIFSICYFIYNNYYKIDVRPFTYVFISRIVESPDKQHSVLVQIYKTTKDSDSAYIMGTLGTLDNRKGYTKDSKTIFWQKVNSDSIKEKTINDVSFENWIKVAWLDAQNVNINGISLNVNNVYDYRRD